MLQVNFLRDNKERVLEGLKKRQFKNLELVDEAIATDEERKRIQFELDSQLSEINKISKEIGLLMKEGKKKKRNPQNLKQHNIKSRVQN
jgi:seryl-tRNA synthetase